MTRRWRQPVALGLALGLVFGIWNLISTRLHPLAEDTVGAVLAFYGPMFALWAAVAFVAARRTGRLRDGVAAGLLVAFATFCVLDLLVIARANLFLDELRGRSDWQALMAGFRASGSGSLRGYINLHYLSQAPLKIAAASIVGVVLGGIGGGVALLLRPRRGGRGASPPDPLRPKESNVQRAIVETP